MAGAFVLSRSERVQRWSRGAPHVSRAMIVEGDDGAVAAVLASYRGKKHSSYELFSFDVRSGKRTGTLELESAPGGVRLFKPVGGRLWIQHADGKLALVDLGGPSVEISRDALVAAVPELAAGYQVTHDRISEFSPPTSGVRVTLHDGRIGWIDMTPAFRTSPPPTHPWPLDYFCDPKGDAKASCLRPECLAFAPLPGTSALALSLVPPYTGTRRHVASPVAEDASPLLRASLVERLDTECAIETDDGVLVIRDSAAMQPKETLLSLVERASGQLRWTRRFAELTDLADARVLGARLVAGEIVLLLRDPGLRVLELVRVSVDGDVLARHRLL